MKQIIAFLMLAWHANGQTIYSKVYGSPTNEAVVFIHGGPSGNATLFEATTTQMLADQGFYVIVFDRRGEGRSKDSTASFTYAEFLNDLDQIYTTYKINKASLLADSFGGLVATLFAEKHPQKVRFLILAGALISQQETYDAILQKTKEIYQLQNDTAMLNRIQATKSLDKKSAEYRKECFALADFQHFFDMPNPTEASKKLREKYQASEFYKNNIRNALAPSLFYKNESRTNIDIQPVLQKLKTSKVKIRAIYGLQDQIFSRRQLQNLEQLVGKNNFKRVNNCSHYLFVDQQEQCIRTITEWLK